MFPRHTATKRKFLRRFLAGSNQFDQQPAAADGKKGERSAVLDRNIPEM